MSKIALDQEQIELVQEAVTLIRQKDALQTQKTQTQSEIAEFKITHTASIGADNWIIEEFVLAHTLMNRLQYINIKLPDIKARLQQIRDLLVDEQYQQDVQDIINNM